MKQRQRIYYSAEQRAEIWDRWQRGKVHCGQYASNESVPPLAIR